LEVCHLPTSHKSFRTGTALFVWGQLAELWLTVPSQAEEEARRFAIRCLVPGVVWMAGVAALWTEQPKLSNQVSSSQLLYPNGHAKLLDCLIKSITLLLIKAMILAH
jgi:hypothetical protein